MTAVLEFDHIGSLLAQVANVMGEGEGINKVHGCRQGAKF